MALHVAAGVARCRYYYNMETGESQWEAPDELQTQGLEQGDKGVKTFGEEKKKKKKVVVRHGLTRHCQCLAWGRRSWRDGLTRHGVWCPMVIGSKRMVPRVTFARSTA